MKLLIIRSPVYPRWRGEHCTRSLNTKTCLGLSPLARGTPQNSAGTASKWRFIPAGAGNTCCSTGGLIQRPVYPRWRGEHAKKDDGRFCQPGLSPLARGTRHQYRPAPFATPVYPRWRGEHGTENMVTASQRGLSPLARGTRLHVSPIFIS
ncbi:Domain of uncharacterised function (DUF2825) [Salmonella enterica subsp. enterica serovar Senftenberg]|nr:hypothetical protein SEES8400_06206 [Salmonella enterica subsp. enterica serovar Senftenberg str. ATCC 8400]SQI14908.1 Domain of uncharacterised function (DUF2825) [Salmonella enterica subsp. enterica serovar Senftenberg]